ncbi:TPA: endonuclease III domain-containing protein [Candidatus Micrarchaeota archaeon]|nr:endonuclease III domain-containing protein [Candidatus Micrarchaeota archaeon]
MELEENRVKAVYSRLLSAFGPRGWWPIAGEYRNGDYSTPRNSAEAEEVCIGAILAQNTAWKNVEKALDGLRAKGLLILERIAKAESNEVAECIRSSGYYNQKTLKLKAFAGLVENSDGVNDMLDRPVEDLRKELLLVNGIGFETADSIVLYAARKPVFVVDAYTKRVFSRLGLLDEDAGYAEFKDFFEESLAPDFRVLNEYHALLVELGKRSCFKNDPDCTRCALRGNCEFARNKSKSN